MVRFIYAGSAYSKEREVVCSSICYIISTLIDLPENIEIEFKNLKGDRYGETLLDPRFKNRLRLDETLNVKEVMLPLVHELLHLNQTHTGKLSVRRDGVIVWGDRHFKLPNRPITYDESMTLPWEQDVANKQQFLLEIVLKVGTPKY